jgi:hypothetical protein
MTNTDTTLVSTPLVGLEDLQRAAFYVFFEGMNNSLDEIQARWEDRDARFNTVTGQNIPPTILEHIETKNFYEGHKPSLIRGNPDLYPNVAVFGTQATPAPESDRFDQLDSWLDSLLVEVMVRGNDEETTNRRIQRTVEAAILCLRRNPTLGGAVFGMQTAPTVIISDLFAVNSPSQGGAYPGERNSTGSTSGARYLWQGAQIQFRVQKDSVSPSSGPGTFADASQIDYSQYIDQG